MYISRLKNVLYMTAAILYITLAAFLSVRIANAQTRPGAEASDVRHESEAFIDVSSDWRPTVGDTGLNDGFHSPIEATSEPDGQSMLSIDSPHFKRVSQTRIVAKYSGAMLA